VEPQCCRGGVAMVSRWCRDSAPITPPGGVSRLLKVSSEYRKRYSVIKSTRDSIIKPRIRPFTAPPYSRPMTPYYLYLHVQVYHHGHSGSRQRYASEIAVRSLRLRSHFDRRPVPLEHRESHQTGRAREPRDFRRQHGGWRPRGQGGFGPSRDP